MKKAFDSVSLEMLRLALKRIKIPELMTNFLINLYNKRKIRVITEFGLTKEFEAEDGLDQGEVISPLMWRIFYDPLLCLVQKEENLEYRIEVNWPFDLKTNKTKSLTWQQGVLAYADDTTWIAGSRVELQKIIDISTEFYKLNNIEINNKKSELLVLNSSCKNVTSDDRLEVNLGELNEVVKAKRGNVAIRHLGV